MWSDICPHCGACIKTVLSEDDGLTCPNCGR